MGKPYIYLPVQPPLRDEILAWGEKHVSDDALANKGREERPHITLFYGLPDNAARVEGALRGATRGLLGAAKTKITHASYFRHSDQSVLVLNCASSGLNRIVTSLSERFGISYTLNAHITVAYIQKGKEVRSNGLIEFIGRTVESSTLVYVTSDKQHLEFVI